MNARALALAALTQWRQGREFADTIIQRILAPATLSTADRPGAKAAARRLLELDPIGTPARALAGRLVLFSVPAGTSPTATGTPLSPATVSAAAAVPGTAPPAGATPPPAAMVPTDPPAPVLTAPPAPVSP